MPASVQVNNIHLHKHEHTASEAEVEAKVFATLQALHPAPWQWDGWCGIVTVPRFAAELMHAILR